MATETGEVTTKQGEATTSDEKELTSTAPEDEIKKLRSDLLTFKGREAKAREELKQLRQEQAEAKVKSEAAAAQRELEEIELDPESPDYVKKRAAKAVEIYNRKMAGIAEKAKAEAELDKRLVEKGEYLTRADKIERAEKIEALASEKKVDLSALKKAAEFETDLEKIAHIADLLPRIQPKDTPSTDSGKTTSGSPLAGKSPRDLIEIGLSKK